VKGWKNVGFGVLFTPKLDPLTTNVEPVCTADEIVELAAIPTEEAASAMPAAKPFNSRVDLLIYTYSEKDRWIT
jgi:hypothetical protein